MIEFKYSIDGLKQEFRRIPEQVKSSFKKMNKGKLLEIPASELNALPKIQRDMAKAMGLDKVDPHKKLKPRTSAKVVKFISEKLFKN